MKHSNKLADILFIILLFTIVATAFFSISPYHILVPHRDSGIFLQIGSEILNGKVLYQQAWGNPQPLIFYINAIGLWFGQGTVWGVWGLELFFFLVMISLSYRILSPAFSPFNCFFIVFISFIAIFQFMSGNFTEEYALLFQVGILAILFIFYLPNRFRHSRTLASIGIGFLIGVVFYIKQSYLDIGISVIIMTIFLSWVEKNRKLLINLSLMGLGFILVNFIFIFYFFKQGALKDYITSAYLFNRYYLNLGLLEWIHTVLENFEFLSGNPFLVIMCTIWLGSLLILFVAGKKIFIELFFNNYSKWIMFVIGLVCFLLFFWGEARGGSPGIGLLGWAAIITGTIFLGIAFLLAIRRSVPVSSFRSISAHIHAELSRIDWTHPGTASFLFLGLLDLPIVLLTISLSGRNYTHYYISLFPAIFLLLAGALSFLYKIVTDNSHKMILNCFLVALLLSGSFTPVLYFLSDHGQSTNDDPFFKTAVYLNSVTTPQEKILMWGWESVIYYLAEREPPTRYAFQFPAYFDSPYKQIVLTTLLEDIRSDPPSFIADTMNEEMPLIEGRSGDNCLSGSTMKDENLRSIISFICTNYEFVMSIETINIYKLK